MLATSNCSPGELFPQSGGVSTGPGACVATGGLLFSESCNEADAVQSPSQMQFWTGIRSYLAVAQRGNNLEYGRRLQTKKYRVSLEKLHQSGACKNGKACKKRQSPVG